MSNDYAIAERTLPHSLEAERAVLGAILIDDVRLADVAEVLKEGDFYRDAHRRIYRQMLALASLSKAIDTLTIKDALAAVGDLDEVGGPAYIAALIDGVPRGTHVTHYAQIVHERCALRNVIYTANKMLTDAYEAEDDAEHVVDQAEHRLFDLKTGQGPGGLQKLSAILPRIYDQIEAWSKAPGEVTGIPSGFIDLDAMTRGFQPSTLVIVAARPAMGKSAFILNIAQHVASSERVVAFFSLEMSHEELALRSIAAEAGIDGHRLQRGRIWPSEWGRLSYAIGALSERNLYIDESPFVTVFDIKARCRRLKAQARLDLVVVDYTQLMIGSEKHQNRNLEVSAITRGLKAMSKDLKLPVIALSQLNRDLERRDNKRPLLSDLRDSGAIEQDADAVIFIYRDEVYDENSQDKGIAELIIAKHRNGPIGTVKVGWQGEHTRFVNLSVEQSATDQRLPVGDR